MNSARWFVLLGFGATCLFGCSESELPNLEGLSEEAEAPGARSPTIQLEEAPEETQRAERGEEERGEERVEERGEERVEERGEERVEERGEEERVEEERIEEIPREEAPEEEDVESEPEASSTPSTSVQAEITEELIVSLFAEIEPASRPRKRLNVDQLDRAFQQVTGGIEWKNKSTDSESLFEKLSLSLGRPDYQDRTAEDLSPGALFQKFLSDASRKVCSELIARELTSTPEQRVFLQTVSETDALESHPNEVRENLVLLLEKFHGQAWEMNAPQLEPWIWLFESATHISDDPIVAWNTVCVALFQHPDFYSY